MHLLLYIEMSFLLSARQIDEEETQKLNNGIHPFMSVRKSCD